jgi:hypothetical protein
MLQDTAEFEIHRRLVRDLEGHVQTRDWWVWIHFHLDEETDVSIAGLAREVETWLSSLDPDVEIESGYPLAWDGGGIHVELKAIPRKPGRRGGPPLVANPLPAVAFWT